MENNISQDAEFGFRTLYEHNDVGLLDYVTEADHRRPTTNIPGFKETTRYAPKYSQAEIDSKERKSKRVINKFFSNMARLGMSLDEQVIKNMRALPADKSLLPKEKQEVTSSLYNQLLSAWKVKDNKDRNFFEKDFASKRDQLRALAMQPELEDILDKMTNESIVYDSNYVYFMEPYIDDNDLVDFSKDIQNKINDSITRSFKRFYRMLGWRTRAWDDFKRWLIEGIIALEIVYDSLEKPTQIIGLVPIDPATLTKTFENDKWYWVQFAGITGKERKLLDSQVIYVQFQETQSISRVSYLERLIRPYNIYRIIEQAQIIWVVTNAQYRTKFTIPVKGMNRMRGSQTLNAAMNRYREDIKFIADTGELTINGQAQMPFNKEYWMPESEARATWANCDTETTRIRLRGHHPLRPGIQSCSPHTSFYHSARPRRRPDTQARNTPRATPDGYHTRKVWPGPLSLATTHGISFPAGTEMFHFPAYPPQKLR